MPKSFSIAFAAIGSAVVFGLAAESGVRLIEPTSTIILTRESGQVSEIVAKVGQVLEQGEAIILIRNGASEDIISAPYKGSIKQYGANVDVNAFLNVGDFIAELKSMHVNGVVTLREFAESDFESGNYCCIEINNKSFNIQIDNVIKNEDFFFFYFSSQNQATELMKLLESEQNENLKMSFQLSHKEFPLKNESKEEK